MAYTELENYKHVVDESGQVSQVNGQVVLQHIMTQEMVSAAYEDVEIFYNLRRESVEVDAENHTEIFKWSTDQTNFLLGLYEDNFKQIGPMKKYRTKKHMWVYISEAISIHLGVKVTPEQVEGRFKTVIKKKPNQLSKTTKPAGQYEKLYFSNIMNNIIKNDDSLFPEICMGPNKIITKQANLQMDVNKSSSSSASANLELAPSTSACASLHSPPSRSHDAENMSPNAWPSIDFDVEDAADVVPVSSTPKRKQKCLVEKMVDRLIDDKKVRFAEKEKQKERRHQEKMAKFSELGNLLSNVLQPKAP